MLARTCLHVILAASGSVKLSGMWIIHQESPMLDDASRRVGHVRIIRLESRM